ncbi:IclR family transcriptional regulator [Desulfosporosinus metallidurans]|uniref:Transcriptional regulator, IclR family n=1 Tax=Desulfosporosinus metallidurans TaxID=1888891 RepID=A0A1Q8QXG6_9FIRM|nr:IclR family transcriptional regulator [Desulfosporosinus metallidurans]OLN31985.1 Transcriptional regulator, IclR family [Desulfosporosinus metallidurans]
MALKTLDNALEILRYFTYEHPAWGVRELAKELNISHSIIYRVLATFEDHGFLVQNEDTKKYELGIKFWEYGLIVRSKLRISDMIYPTMEKLANETGESVFLTWLDELEGICVDIAESSQRVKFAVSIGSRTPLYAGASNKIIMAYVPEKDQLAIIEKGLQEFAGYTIVDPQKLLKNLEEIRLQGWCYSLGEYSDAVVGVALPLFTRKRKITGSITVAGPEYRFPESKVREVLTILEIRTSEIQAYLDTIL